MPAYKYVHDVQMAHCDGSGIIFLPRYYEMIHTVLENWFDEALDWPMAQILGSSGMQTPFRRLDTEFYQPGRLGDRLIWQLEMTGLGETSLDLRVQARSSAGGGRLLTAHGTLVLTEKGIMRTRRWPDTFRTKVEDFRAKP